MTARATLPADAAPADAAPPSRPGDAPMPAGRPSAPRAPEPPTKTSAEGIQTNWADRPVPSRARRIYSSGSLLRRRVAVRLLKVILPAAALALLGAIVLWPEFERNGENARLSFRRLSRATPEAVRVVDPRYQGLDEEGRPFNVTAFIASQQGSENIVDLEAPRGDLTQANGSWLLVESRAGRFDRDNNILDLKDDVTIWQDDGTLIETQEARVDVKQGHAEGNLPIAAQGSFGTITGEGFRLRDRGQVVVFTGHAHAVLEGGQ